MLMGCVGVLAHCCQTLSFECFQPLSFTFPSLMFPLVHLYKMETHELFLTTKRVVLLTSII